MKLVNDRSVGLTEAQPARVVEGTAQAVPFFRAAAALNVLAVLAWLFIRTDRPLEGC